MTPITAETKYEQITHAGAVGRRLDGAVIRYDVDDVRRAYHEATRVYWEVPDGLYVVTVGGPGPDSDFVELETRNHASVGPESSGALWFVDGASTDQALWRLGPLRPSIDETPDEVVDAEIFDENELATLHPSTLAILRWFEYKHLAGGPRLVSAHLSGVASTLAVALKDTEAGAELTTGLRKLLEAKDCFVRAAIAVPEPTPVTEWPEED